MVTAFKERTSQRGPNLTHNAEGLALTVRFSASFMCSEHDFTFFGDSRPLLQISTATMSFKLFTYIIAN